MLLVIDTTQDLSAQDLEILALMTGGTAPAAGKVAPAKKAAAPAKAAAAAPDPEPEADDDLLGSAPTMADAVALATKLVSGGQSQKVKDALAASGAKRVSELAEDAIPAFVAALSD